METDERTWQLLTEMRADVKVIKEQTIKTNGRVTSLEKQQADCPIKNYYKDREDLYTKLRQIDEIHRKQEKLSVEVTNVKKMLEIFSVFYNRPKTVKAIIYLLLTLLGYNTIFNLINNFI
jgi:hypothetical protein